MRPNAQAVDCRNFNCSRWLLRLSPHFLRDRPPLPSAHRAGGQPVGRAADTASASIQDVRVDHRRPNVLVPKEFLHRANVVAVSQQVRGKRMAERVARDSLRQPGLSNRLLDGFLDEGLVNVVSSLLAGSRVHPAMLLGKHELPNPLAIGVRDTCGPERAAARRDRSRRPRPAGEST